MLKYLVLLLFGYAVGSTTPPRITEHPSDVTVPRHEPATLYCAATGHPAPAISWYKDGHPLTPSASRVLLPTGALLFLRVAPRDAGVYRCGATSPAGDAQSRNATLQVGVLREEFRVSPADQRVAQGETALLECSPPRGVPEPRVSWVKDGRPVDTSSDRMEIVDGGNLAIKNTMKSDEGSYKCVAKNAVGARDSAAAQLKVYVKPYLLRAPQDAVAMVGGSVTLRCEAGGDPEPTVVWRRPNTGDVGGRALQDDGGLRLEGVTERDEGEYVCDVDNDVGWVSAAATVTVLSPPVIAVRPAELTVEEGQDVVFSCGVRGKPAPTVFWMTEANHSLLLPGSENGKFKVSTGNEGLFILTVKEVARSDDGLVVMCGAVSSVGSDSWFAPLSVVSPGDHPPPVIQLGPTNQTLPLHTPGTLVCRASGDPEPVVTWYKDGVPVTFDLPRVSVDEDGTLTITDLLKTDEGLYTCVASSRTGKATWSASLHLEPRTNPNAAFYRSPEPSALPGPPSSPVLVNTSASSITIAWTRNNKIGSSSLIGYQVEMYSRSHSGGWVVVARRVPGPTHTQHFLQPNASYRFIVRAENSHGLSPASAPSAVLSLASPPPRDDTVKEARASLSTGHVVELTSAQAVSPHSVQLAWEILSSDFVEGLLIFSQALDPPDNSISMLTVLHSDDTSGFLVTGLAPNTQYQFFLMPFYRAVDGRPSNSKRVTTLEDVPSEPPTNLEAVLINKSTVHLKWKYPLSNGQNGIISSYQVLVRFRDGSKETVLTNVTVDATTPNLLVTNLTAGVTYSVQVAAATGAGLGPFSKPASLRVDPSSKLQGYFGEPIGVQPGLEVSESDLMSETWFMALLGSMVAVMLMFFTAMLYVWKKQVLKSKGYLQDSCSNGGMLTPSLNFKGLKVTLSHPHNMDTDLWINSLKSGVRDNQLYSEVPRTARDYADVSVMQRVGNDTSAYAYTTLVPSPSARPIEGSNYNRVKSYHKTYTSFGYQDRKLYSENYNFLKNQDYSSINGNINFGAPMTMVVSRERTRAFSDPEERETESRQLETSPLPPTLPTMSSVYHQNVDNAMLTQERETFIGEYPPSPGNPSARTFSTFSRQSQRRINTPVYHKATRSEPSS